MNVRLLAAALLALRLATLARAVDEEPEKKQTVKDAMRAQLIEDAKKNPAKPAPAAAAPAATKADPAAKSTSASPTAPAPSPSAEKEKAALDSSATPPAKPTEPATVLPKVEVNRGKVSPLARELYEKEKEIVREKQLTKSGELDKALNHPKVTVPLFGGQSTTSRQSIASERVSLLEAEADLIEEIAHAKTKEQKAELRKQLDGLKKVRRELEQSLR